MARLFVRQDKMFSAEKWLGSQLILGVGWCYLRSLRLNLGRFLPNGSNKRSGTERNGTMNGTKSTWYERNGKGTERFRPKNDRNGSKGTVIDRFERLLTSLFYERPVIDRSLFKGPVIDRSNRSFCRRNGYKDRLSTSQKYRPKPVGNRSFIKETSQ